MARKHANAIRVQNPEVEELGPAMLALTEHQRRWVVGYAMCGDATSAARSAGYSDVKDAAKVRGFELLRNTKVIDALQEWTRGALNGRGAYVAITALIEIAADPEHKRRYEAADSLADRVGFARQTNHQVSVEHTDNRSTADLMDVLERFAGRRRLPVVGAVAVEVGDGAAQEG